MFGKMKTANHKFIMDRAKAVGNVVKKAPAAASGSGKKVHPKPSQSVSAPTHKGSPLGVSMAPTAQNRKYPGKYTGTSK